MQRCRCGKRDVVEGEALCRLCQAVEAFKAIMKMIHNIKITDKWDVKIIPMISLEGATDKNDERFSLTADNHEGTRITGGALINDKPWSAEWHDCIFLHYIHTPFSSIRLDEFYTYRHIKELS